MLKKYLPHQLIQFLTPKAVCKEFGIPTETLSHLRECSKDYGVLRGPRFLKDGNIILYRRDAVIKYIEQNMFPEESQETQEPKKTRQLNKA